MYIYKKLAYAATEAEKPHDPLSVVGRPRSDYFLEGSGYFQSRPEGLRTGGASGQVLTLEYMLKIFKKQTHKTRHL